MDGAPADGGWVMKDKRRQGRPRVLRLRGSQNALSASLRMTRCLDLERGTATAKALWLGDDRGREADFSTALRTMRLCAASVEMTVLGCRGEKITDNNKGKGFVAE